MANKEEPESTQDEEIHLIGDEAHGLRVAYGHLVTAKKAHDDAKAEAKKKKDSLERAQATIEQYLKSMMGGPDAMPLFDDRTSGEWENVALASLEDPSIPEHVLRKLDKSDIITIGNLADIRKGDGFQLTSLTGIGAKAATLIEEALEAFWTRRADAKKVGDATK